ncbi:Cell division control protein, putative [Yarrowia lipolytica]|nr:Cell division control protein, putative [Yarrowia lipolytica]
MVVGESGTGKTTFLNTLFADELLKRVGSRRRPFPFGGQEEESAYEYTGDESANSQHHRTTKIESATFDLEEEGVTVRFTVIDTPGFGNYVNNTNSWVPIVEYLDDQHRQYLVQEEQPERSRIRDVRVHVCVYFLKPGYRLMPLDIRAMKELSKRVNLIPVVSKADTFTIPEMEAFKANVRAAIDAHKIQIYTPSDDYNLGSLYTSEVPLSIIGCHDSVMGRDGQQTRGRQYAWGVAEVDNPDHCDFVRLREIMMSHCMLDLIDTTVEQHYASYRMQKIELARSAMKDAGASEEDITAQPFCMLLRKSAAQLQEHDISNSIKFQAKVVELNRRFAKIVEKQEENFSNWETELTQKQDEFNADIKKIHRDVIDLEAAVDILSYRVRNDPKDTGGRISKGKANVADIFHRDR